ncbi:MAG: M28 family peptidase [Candidatus Eiseniibacteriota bacterium]
MRLPVVLFAVAVSLAPAAPRSAFADLLEPPYDVYEAGPVPIAVLGRERLEPWRIVHQERQGDGAWLLLALPDGSAGADLPGWGRPRYLGRVRPGERLVLVAPEVGPTERLRSGRPLTIAPSQATLLVTTETPHRLAGRARHAFQVLGRSQPPPRREIGPAPGFAPVLEQARSVRPGGGLRAPSDVLAVIAQVRPDSLESAVLQLSERAGFANRYYANPNTEVVHKTYIQAKFAEAIGAANVSNHAFEVTHPDGYPITVHNVVARLPSSRPGAGAFLMTAHYDAIGLRSDPLAICADSLRDLASGCDCSASSAAIGANPACDWDWRTDPTPGADDNATGIATLFEAARLLSPLSFDFDLYFVAFQAEEVGLLGSAAFADSLAGSGREVYGVLNLDMLGYNSQRNRADIVANEGSEWLADFVVETSQLFVPDLPVEKHVVFFGRSDHASFWSAGIDAILLFEDFDLPYPGYHTHRDLWNTMFPPAGRPNSELQLQLAAQLAVGTIARFALHYDAPDLALPAGELTVAPAPGSRFEAGSPMILTARVHNYGTSTLDFQGTLTDSLAARVTFYDGDPAQGAPVIAEIDRRDFFAAGGVVEIAAGWTTSPGQEGFHEIHASVAGLDVGYASTEITAANNSSSTSFFLEAPRGSAPRLLTHYPVPNPVRGGRQDVGIYFELTTDADRVTVFVYDLGGQRVGAFHATDLFFANGNQAGANRLSGAEDFRWEGPDLESGVYLYSIRCFDSSGSVADEGEGKFALVR